MMSKIRTAAQTAAERLHARRGYKATAHLDARTLRDIGVTRDDWRRMSYRD